MRKKSIHNFIGNYEITKCNEFYQCSFQVVKKVTFVPIDESLNNLKFNLTLKFNTLVKI